MNYHLAIDIGASSGRHILGHLENGQIQLEEVYRFENTLYEKNGALCWDIDALSKNVLCGLRACKDIGKIPKSVGIDTWAIDFVLLDEKKKRLGEAVSYRDERGARAVDRIEALISPKNLYRLTGIQKQPFNTIFQLGALQAERPELLEKAAYFLMIPDYLHYLLTGKISNEYTNATSTALIDAKEKNWSETLLDTLGYPKKIFQKLSMPGTVLGTFTKDVQEKVGFTSQVILPCTHDTACAFLAVPAKDDRSIYISSGTWSLLGTEEREPELRETSRLFNFTNEGGYQDSYRYLKNIMGLWLIQSIRRDHHKKYSYQEMENMARASTSFTGKFDINDAAFLSPPNMEKAVRTYFQNRQEPPPETLGETIQCIYLSLADSYAKAIRELEILKGKTFTGIHIVGGGSKDTYLNQLTANATGLPVYGGPVECTALGNIIAQCLSENEIPSVEAARDIIRKSFSISCFQPKEEPS